ncbi:excisionase family DNA-binding protein [Gordonia sp. ABSL11-1]|uniref:helix-turn-helix domain-containing protein n=1 Tax=Gordonia sp. ABSL11-1 TaxID=3053924 RepID=UPI0025733C8E|nr:helix-turn-helix domain-containing protein [Gordonia sp. ABSL11-1]MDL9948562.1 excisionase family DNA-binding protein [Gordonia sp. ABSL11-1]
MSAPVDHTVLPSKEEDYVSALKLLAGILSSDAPLRLSADGGGESVPVPDSVRNVLQQAVASLGELKAVTVSEQNTLLTTQEAAELLGISRPTLVRLLKSDAIPYTQPNRHRRIRLEDVLQYQRESSAQRRAILDQMTDDAQDDDMYRTVNGFVKTR